MSASVLDVVPNKPIELAGRLCAAGVVTSRVVSLVAVHHLSIRNSQYR